MAGTPRPLDGNGDTTNRVDMGCYEFVHATADSDNDQIPDSFEVQYGLNPTVDDAAADYDGDGADNFSEYIADTHPLDSEDLFKILQITGGTAPVSIYIDSSSSRFYSLVWRTNLLTGIWLPVAGQSGIAGTGGELQMEDSSASTQKFYRVNVSLSDDQ